MPHIHETIDFTSEVFIVYKNKVLLRKHDKYKIWLGAGGHIELDEDPNQAAIREVKEEVGLDVVLDDSLQEFHQNEAGIKELIPPYFMNRNRINAKHEHVTLIYFAKSKTDKIVELVEREKSEECRWFTKEAIEANKEIMDNIKVYALKALEKLGNN
ncbi:MAG TPA: NUDIX domain-containing protein [Patescibacteria group bacterium]|nr:NUDIX domain-containing protein [Patescibacteria group bacterium]